MIKKGDLIEIFPEFRDPGDEKYTWFSMDDEEKGRIIACPLDHPMSLRPTFTMLASQVRRIG